MKELRSYFTDAGGAFRTQPNIKEKDFCENSHWPYAVTFFARSSIPEGWARFWIHLRMLLSMKVFVNPEVIHLSKISPTTLKQRSVELCLAPLNHHWTSKFLLRINICFQHNKFTYSSFQQFTSTKSLRSWRYSKKKKKKIFRIICPFNFQNFSVCPIDLIYSFPALNISYLSFGQI